MLHGVLTQRQFGSSGNAASALIDFDFLLGTYFVNGAAVSLTDVLDLNPSWVTANGLEILYTNGPGVIDVIGAALAEFTSRSEWTLVLEVDTTGSGNAQVNFIWGTEAVDANNDRFFFYRNSSGGLFYTNALDERGGASRSVQESAEPMTPAGVHRLAGTLSNTELSISCNGSAVSTSVDTDPTNPWQIDGVSLGGEPGFNIDSDYYLRSLILYEPLAASDLPALSAA